MGELVAPVDGDVVAVNHEVVDDPSLVNSDPFGAGWLIKLKIDVSQLDGMLDHDGYVKLTEDAA